MLINYYQDKTKQIKPNNIEIKNINNLVLKIKRINEQNLKIQNFVYTVEKMDMKKT